MASRQKPRPSAANSSSVPSLLTRKPLWDKQCILAHVACKESTETATSIFQFIQQDCLLILLTVRERHAHGQFFLCTHTSERFDACHFYTTWSFFFFLANSRTRNNSGQWRCVLKLWRRRTKCLGMGHNNCWIVWGRLACPECSGFSGAFGFTISEEPLEWRGSFSLTQLTQLTPWSGGISVHKVCKSSAGKIVQKSVKSTGEVSIPCEACKPNYHVLLCLFICILAQIYCMTWERWLHT